MTEPNPYQGPSPVQSFPFSTAASLNLINTGCILMGFALMESSGANPAAVIFRDGNDDNAPVVIPVAMLAGQSERGTFSSWGVLFQRGLRLSVINGAVTGAAFLILP